MSEKILSLLIRSERVALEQLQGICNRLAGMIQKDFSENLSGKIHVLPERRRLEWLEHPLGDVTAAITTTAFFRKKWMAKKIPKIPDPTIVIECHLKPIDSDTAFEEACSTAELLTKKLIGFMTECELEVRETRLVNLPISPTSSIWASLKDLMGCNHK
ncbi:MAG: hypothetical protein ACE5OZ_25625 [Candidatus Heimdallarchaeota archaeon]